MRMVRIGEARFRSRTWKPPAGACSACLDHTTSSSTQPGPARWWWCIQRRIRAPGWSGQSANRLEF